MALFYPSPRYNFTMTEEGNDAAFKARVRQYAEALNPLFDSRGLS